MMQQTTFGAETSRWPDTRQNWAITTPPVAGMYATSPSAPSPGGWPPLNSTSLPGLESLMHLDRIFIDQKIEPLEVLTSFNTKNKYAIMNGNGQHLFDLKEDSSLLSRLCCGAAREFEILVFDASKRQVLRLYRPMQICLGELEVYSGDKRLGSINQKCGLRPEFDIRDEYGNMVFQIGGPLCQCNCFGPQKFKVFSADASRQIGLISKEWSGLPREMFTQADVFGVSFPINLDIQLKALLIGAAILIDFEYYEAPLAHPEVNCLPWDKTF